MSSPVSFRSAQPHDLEVLRHISRITFFETFADDNTSEDMQLFLDTQFSAERLHHELCNTQSRFYFATIEERIVGYIKLNYGAAQTEHMGDDSIEIERIYIKKEFQRQQIGGQMMLMIKQLAEQQNSSTIWLGVWERNTNAIQFYTQFGFVAFGKHQFLLGNDEQIDILMKLTINP